MQQTIQRYLDRTVVWIRTRWILLLLLTLLYGFRVYVKQGFYVVTYGLGIYLLNLLINFLSPAVDPETEDDGSALPMNSGTEFRPFSRKLPEFKFWRNASQAVLGSLFMTCFSIFDLPVFWPILLAYFILLLILTMKDRVKHMVKFGYVPWSSGKQTYGELTKLQPGQAGGKAAKNDK